MNTIQKAAEMSNFNYEYDISVSLDHQFEGMDKEVIENIRSLDEITEMNIIHYYGSIVGDVEKANF